MSGEQEAPCSGGRCHGGCGVKEASAIEVIQSLVGVLLSLLIWLLGSVAFLLVALCLPPIHLRARVDSVRIDEETPLDWDEVSFRAQVSGLLGALKLRFELSGGASRTQMQLFGFTKALSRHGEEDRDIRDSEDSEHSKNKENSGHSAPGQRNEGRRPTRSGYRQRPKSATKGKSRTSIGPRINLSFLRRLLPDAVWLFKKALRQLNLNIRGRLVYGLSDPFATALVHGLVAALPPFPELSLQPDYAQARLEGWSELSLRVYPWQAALLIIQAIFRPGVRSMWWPRLRSALRIIPKRTKEVIST